ncbi:hypothetical protein CG51_07385 [Haematobacter missouriensis]|uniref:hypothetical protein n=1 Tax=Haematobacter missouriensis TaxID=366616 RepID=UPI0004E921A8|nr:hypothetical protein [Haematobacter missouriensis]KFI29519.1 hypothetical protein CG51_07385 [Haematobacter missouriensis]
MSWLRTGAAKLARRRGAKRAMIALARRIAAILHRMWKDQTDFRFDTPCFLPAEDTGSRLLPA